MHRHRPAIRVDNPDCGSPSAQPVIDFGQNSAGGIVGRKHFDGQIWWTREKPSGRNQMKSRCNNKRNVGGPDGVWFLSNEKPGFCREERSQSPCLHMVIQERANSKRHASMARAGRTHHD